MLLQARSRDSSAYSLIRGVSFTASLSPYDQPHTATSPAGTHARRTPALCGAHTIGAHMPLNCRPGDLALVIHDEANCAANIGRIVRVQGPIARNSYYDRLCWLVFPTDMRPWRCHAAPGKAQWRWITPKDQIDHPDAWLMPLQLNSICLLKTVQKECSPNTLSPAPREQLHHLHTHAFAETSAKLTGQRVTADGRSE